jgi:hypothetical protein
MDVICSDIIRLGNIRDAQASIPVNYTLCDFGKWYYGDGQILSNYPEYKDLELVHQMVHDTYLQIYNLYKKRIEGTLFNSEKKQLRQRDEKANKLSLVLTEYSKILFDALLNLESKIMNLSDEAIKKMNF